MAGLSAALAPNNPRTRTRTRMRHAYQVPVVVRSLRALPKKKKTSFRDRNNRKSRCCEVKRRSRTRAEDLLELLERESEKELEDRKKSWCKSGNGVRKSLTRWQKNWTKCIGTLSKAMK